MACSSDIQQTLKHSQSEYLLRLKVSIPKEFEDILMQEELY